MKKDKGNGKDMYVDLAISIKKYNIVDGDVVIVQLPNDIDMGTLKAIQKTVVNSIGVTGKKASTIIMTEPMDIYRLKPTDMAILGWFPVNPDTVDRLNKGGAITYTERLTLMMMHKRLRSMLPKDPQDLLNGNMKIKP